LELLSATQSVFEPIDLTMNGGVALPNEWSMLASPLANESKLYPMFDPLRDDPRFQILVASPMPNNTKR
jgi:hypothetical protein